MRVASLGMTRFCAENPPAKDPADDLAERLKNLKPGKALVHGDTVYYKRANGEIISEPKVTRKPSS
jgi:hypothetical protein